MLNGLAPDLPPKLLVEAFAAARVIGDEEARAEALAGLVPYLSPELLAEAVVAARAIGPHSSPMLAKMGGDRVIRETAGTIRDTATWWP
jgi:hypothetical protein